MTATQGPEQGRDLTDLQSFFKFVCVHSVMSDSATLWTATYQFSLSLVELAQTHVH